MDFRETCVICDRPLRAPISPTPPPETRLPLCRQCVDPGPHTIAAMVAHRAEGYRAKAASLDQFVAQLKAMDPGRWHLFVAQLDAGEGEPDEPQ